MKAVIQVDLNVAQAEDAKSIVEDTCRKLQEAGLISSDYRFEIETAGRTRDGEVRSLGGEGYRLKGMTLPVDRAQDRIRIRTERNRADRDLAVR